jgi:hypothetical protein
VKAVIENYFSAGVLSVDFEPEKNVLLKLSWNMEPL